MLTRNGNAVEEPEVDRFWDTRCLTVEHCFLVLRCIHRFRPLYPVWCSYNIGEMCQKNATSIYAATCDMKITIAKLCSEILCIVVNIVTTYYTANSDILLENFKFHFYFHY